MPTTHGHRYTRVYQKWIEMRRRCSDPTRHEWPNYGGRGIIVCERWDVDFTAFLADMGYPPPGMSIERIENNGNYEPGNCRWATSQEQASNRRSSIFLEHGGRRMTMEQWCADLGMAQTTLWNRIFTHHWPVDKALSTPVRPKTPNRGAKA